MTFLILFSLALLLASISTMLLIFVGSRRMKDLANIETSGDRKNPLVSIIVPACNEADTLEPALRSLYRQD